MGTDFAYRNANHAAGKTMMFLVTEMPEIMVFAGKPLVFLLSKLLAFSLLEMQWFLLSKKVVSFLANRVIDGGLATQGFGYKYFLDLD